MTVLFGRPSLRRCFCACLSGACHGVDCVCDCVVGTHGLALRAQFVEALLTEGVYQEPGSFTAEVGDEGRRT